VQSAIALEGFLKAFFPCNIRAIVTICFASSTRNTIETCLWKPIVRSPLVIPGRRPSIGKSPKRFAKVDDIRCKSCCIFWKPKECYEVEDVIQVFIALL
jgi:hypothetical protein